MLADSAWQRMTVRDGSYIVPVAVVQHADADVQGDASHKAQDAQPHPIPAQRGRERESVSQAGRRVTLIPIMAAAAMIRDT